MQSVFYNFKMKKKYETDLDFFYTKSIPHYDKIVKICNIFHIPKISLGNIPTRKLRLSKKKISNFNSKIIKIFLSLCKRNNIQLCLEPISKRFNCNFLNDTKKTVKFINNLNHQNLRLLFDTGNVEENNQNVLNLLKKNLGIIGHIQIRSKNPKYYSLNKITQFLNLLEKNNYRKTVTIEYFSKKNFYKFEKLVIFLKRNYNTYI